MRIITALVLLAGCSSDTDLSGVYRVDLDVDSMPCGNDQPAAMSPAYIKFNKVDFFGQTTFSFQTCDDAAGTNCMSGGLFFGFFSEPIDNGWRGEVTTSSGGGTSCALSYQNDTAILTGAKVVVEHNNYGDILTLPDAQCTTDEAGKRGTSMTCKEHERIEATKM